LAGYIILKSGRIPGVKEKLLIDDYEFTILKKNKSTIVLVKMQEIEQEV
jgi:CBS domain containing-hemolysin-like protein